MFRHYLRHPLLVVGLALVFAAPLRAQTGLPSSRTHPLIIDVDGRATTSLDGRWRTIVDPFQTGYYNYRWQPDPNGWFRDRKARRPSDLVEYDFDRAPTLAVPGDWNTQRGELLFYEGTVWYRKTFEYDLKPGHRLFAYFGAANYEARVWLNGHELGVHEGGFTPFDFDVTGFLRAGTNDLVVKVDDARHTDAMPTVNAALEHRYADPHTIVLDDPLGRYLDVLGNNEYLGWYDGTPEKADSVHWKSAFDKPLVMSELGGGALQGLHGSPEARWTEEYQAKLYRHQLPMLERIPFLVGMSPWILKDFRSPRRPLPDIQDYFNRKGLVSERGERKEAFSVLQRFYGGLARREADDAAPGAAPPLAAPGPNTADTVWRDTDGAPIQAHGGGMLKVGEVWYWYGENHRLGFGNRVGISAYSSRDLSHWKNEGVVLPKDSLPERFRDTGVAERPKVIYNARTHRYVMWMHLDADHYTDASAGVAVSDSPTGPFRVVRIFRPVTYDYGYAPDEEPRLHERERGNTFRDMALFEDDDGTAYVLYASESNRTLYVVQLDDDYTDVRRPLVEGKSWARILVDRRREAPAPFKVGGRYYLITSGQSGWAPNEARYHVADRMLGPWKTLGNPAVGPGSATTFGAQSTFVLPLPSVCGRCFLFMADRWNPKALERSTYLWVPFVVADDGSIRIEDRERWDLDTFRELERRR